VYESGFTGAAWFGKNGLGFTGAAGFGEDAMLDLHFQYVVIKRLQHRQILDVV
jgi:hypothetical protein